MWGGYQVDDMRELIKQEFATLARYLSRKREAQQLTANEKWERLGLVSMADRATDLGWTCLMNEWRRDGR